MSRIDQALKRAGTRGPGATVPSNEQAFVSPWSVPAEEPSPNPAVVPAPAPPRVAIPDAPVQVQAPTVVDEPSAEAGIEPHRVVSFGSKWRERLATSPEADPAFVEQFRRLAGTLHRSQAATGIRILMVTSATPDDGKTLTALNLALVLSESYHRRVLLIDADLRRPSLGRAAELTGAPGLSDALKATLDQKLAVIPVTDTLTLLPAGRPDPDPMGALTSPRMKQILDEASARFDWVILDSPPMGPMADAHLLAEMADAAVFVVRAGRTQHALVKKAIEALGRERLLGVVLNGVERMPKDSYAAYEATEPT